jgi:hypothetical protein
MDKSIQFKLNGNLYKDVNTVIPLYLRCSFSGLEFGAICLDTFQTVKPTVSALSTGTTDNSETLHGKLWGHSNNQ